MTKRTGNDQAISIYGAIMMYHKLIRSGKIKFDGAAAKRLMELEKRYANGERQYRS
jgi:hypothetical protein